MTDETRFAVAFRDDVSAVLAGLRARRATRRLALGLERTCGERMTMALATGARERAPWRALWLAISEIVALGADGGEAGALARLRAFLDENADLVAPRLALAGVGTYGERRVLTYATPRPSAIDVDAIVPDAVPSWATEWLLGAWSVVGVITAVAIAVRMLS